MDRLQVLCEQILEEKGWDAEYRFEFLREDAIPRSFLAWIELTNSWTIKFIAHPELERRVDEVIAKTGIDSIADPLYSLLYLAMTHERGHWLICPFNDLGTQAIMKGVSEVMERKLVTESAIQQATQNGFNLVSDLINNVVLSYDDERPERFVEGFTLAYLIYGGDGQAGPGFFSGKIQEAFSLYLNANLTLMQAPNSLYGPLKKYFARFQAANIRRDTAEIANVLLNEELGKRALSSSLLPEDKKEASYLLRNRATWYEASQRLSEVFFRYLKEPNQRFDPNSFNKFLEKMHQQYKQMQQQGQQQPQTSKQNSGPRQPVQECDYELTNDFDDPEGKNNAKAGGNNQQSPSANQDRQKEDEKETIFGGKYKREEPEQPQQSQPFRYPRDFWQRFREAPQRYMELILLDSLLNPEVANFEELDELYRARAAPLAIKLDEPSKRTPEHPFRHMSVNPSDPQNIRPSRILWGRTRAFGDGDFEFYERETPLNLEIPITMAPGGIPDIAWILDSSGSMGWDWKNGAGRYDAAARIVYSIHLSLDKSGKGQHMNYSMINFSDSTRFTGWKPYQQLDEIHRELFRYQNGSTYMSEKALKHLLEQSPDVFLAMMISDGGFNIFTNEAAITRQIREIEDRGNYFALFQIGGLSDFAKRLQDQGSLVIQVNGPLDLYNAAADLTIKAWGAR